MIAADEIQRNGTRLNLEKLPRKRNGRGHVNSPKTCFDYVGIIKSGAKYSVYKDVTTVRENWKLLFGRNKLPFPLLLLWFRRINLCEHATRPVKIDQENNNPTESNMADVKNSVPHLTGPNYPTWKVQCCMALKKEGLWDIVTGEEDGPQQQTPDAISSERGRIVH